MSAVNRQLHCSDSGWKTCPGSVCVPNATDCPITQFAVVSGGPNACPPGTVGAPAFPQNSDSSRYLCTSRSGSAPLVDISNTLGGMCLVAASTPFNPYSKDNPQQGPTAVSVDVSTPPFPCSSSDLDTRYHDIEIRFMGSIFGDNTAAFISEGVATDQVAYWTSITYPVFYKFQIRPEIPFSSSCPNSRADIVNAGADLDLITRAQGALVIISIMSTVLVDVPWTIWSCSLGFKSCK